MKATCPNCGTEFCTEGNQSQSATLRYARLAAQAIGPEFTRADLTRKMIEIGWPTRSSDIKIASATVAMSINYAPDFERVSYGRYKHTPIDDPADD